MPTKRKRINVNLPEILEIWVREQSEASGVSQASVILTCIAKAKEQQEAMNFMARLSKEDIEKVLKD